MACRVRRSTGSLPVPAGMVGARATSHAASCSTTRGATPRFIPDLLGATRRRSPVGRAVARHASERAVHARRRAPAPRRHGRAALPAEGAVGCAAAVAADPPERRAGGRRVARGAYPDDQPKPELLCALTRFEALCGVRPIHLTLPLLGELRRARPPQSRRHQRARGRARGAATAGRSTRGR